MGEGGSRGGGAGTRAWIFSRRASGPAYTAQYPDVIRLKSEIAALERVPKTTAAVGEEFRILDPAVPARNAVAPQRRLFILIGLGLGLGAAAAAVMVADQLDGSFHSLEELRAFSKLPVLVTIPLIGATSPDGLASGCGRPRSQSDWSWSCSPPITSRAATTSWPFCSRAERPERPSDPAFGQELGVVALPRFCLLDLLGRVELREVDDLDVVPGPLEGVLVDERARRVDAHRAREPDVALRPLALAGRAALRGLEGLPEAALADRQDVLLGVHARREGPQDVLDVVDFHVLVDDDAEPRAQRDRERGRQDIPLEPLVAGTPLLDLEDHAAPVGHAHWNMGVDAESWNDSVRQLQEAGFSHDSVDEVLVHPVDDEPVVERPVGAVGDRRRLELVGAIRLAHVARPLRVERMHALRVVLLGERALPYLLGRVDVAFHDVLRVRDRPGILRPRLHELHRVALERAGDAELVAAARQDHVREARARHHRAGRRDPDVDRDRDRPLAVPVRRDLVHLPAPRDLEARVVGPAEVHPVVTDVRAAPEMLAAHDRGAGAERAAGVAVGVRDHGHDVPHVDVLRDHHVLTGPVLDLDRRQGSA